MAALVAIPLVQPEIVATAVEVLVLLETEALVQVRPDQPEIEEQETPETMAQQEAEILDFPEILVVLTQQPIKAERQMLLHEAATSPIKPTTT